ncbi:transposase [Pseudomonas sp. RTC3]|uniref:IS66 family transposase n=1 Tax=unclassified Pseudomonas TaxID=196821 RepID=UPI002AB58791|nr:MULTISPECIES: transposase [unclassified Pseudomonas]MEB0061689.1 transposase [Pseudomonas sp. RTC3]MDY7565218.1 transposase [Pseudomonas sp. 5C2]MEB0009679.1 transposase [Pseudomonas sp. RTB2]MEB0016979.1 transposase [Pseudomonas sp. RTB3]MEB0147376.1 transposase [Pseudomonas sp. CCC2.2]
MTSLAKLDQLDPEQLRALAAQLIQRVVSLDQKVETMDKQIHHHKAVNEILAHEIALLKRFNFAKRSEQLSPAQVSLLDDLIDTDIAAIEAELEALHYIAALYEIEREVKELEPDIQQRIRQEKAAPIIDVLHAWMSAQRQLVPEGSAIAKALDYSLKRWVALSRYLNDGAVPIDNNWAENQIRPWALGRKNWLFAGSLRSGKRAAAIMSLIQSARLNGHAPYAYLRDVLTRLPTQRASEIAKLLPHKWAPA